MSTALPAERPSRALRRPWRVSVSLGAVGALVSLVLLTGPGSGQSWVALSNLIITALLGVWITYSDIRTRLIPNAAIPTLAVLYIGTLLAGVAYGWLSGADALRAAAAFAIVGVAYAFLFIAGGTSPGDVKLAATLALAVGGFGWPAVIVGALASYLLALPEAVIRWASKARQAGMPFGPYLVAGTLLALMGILLQWW